MNATQPPQTVLFQFMRSNFPGSRSIPDAQLKQQIDKAWQKGRHYGLTDEDDLGVYAIAAYALGENFDQEMPEAAAVLQDTSYTSAQKIEWLYTFADDAVQELRLPEGTPAAGGADAQLPAMPGEAAGRPASGNAGDPSDPYQQVAAWAVTKLRKGDLAAILRKFSPGVIAEVGLPKVEAVLREKVIPFFQASLEVSDEVETVKMKYPDGREGYALSSHLFAMKRTKPYIGGKPFTIMVVQENGQFLIAGVDVDREN